ncbi:RlpA-like protein precursor [Vibrio aerogenes CECT 7868]|uniref:Endolytic peptidoglycan transglycosylase RlpA n=1 Tax=Vibrio aerogenes CECT 7868 TaxID=1216006 RepID=A0A1M5Z1B4_9VIBR|nr:septal ring lytic transglycosylase RlpA family protein [Vibrio aerogenes]SHI17981.1 RlpA-like protein precursor [Vibrio aerogenes CECT 7868]
MQIKTDKPFFWLLVCILAGCSSSGRYTIDHDTKPEKPISVEHVEDAQPKFEPYSLGGNKNYTVNGKSYSIIRDPDGYKAKGIASWYGKKFHGHLTSNGEIYDMYSMTAAHKTLPIPSYVKVTNTKNDKSAIVRVNDRGPFHPDRIIDLSYAAAYKLGILQTGTAPVQIEFIPGKKKISEQAKTSGAAHYVIQVSSSKLLDSTRTLSTKLSQTLSVTSFINSLDNKYRVFLGPFDNFARTQHILEEVKRLGYNTAFIRKPPETQEKSDLSKSD